MSLECVIEDARWSALNLDTLVKDAVEKTLGHLRLDATACEISLLACDDARITILNTDFRDKPTPTNVLSWPGEDLSASNPGELPLAPQSYASGLIELGDIAIAYETCAREAIEAGKPLKEHVTHLVVHGTLHLLGYDHIRDQDATLMEGLEAEILGRMGLDNPYKDCNGGDGPHFGLD